MLQAAKNVLVIREVTGERKQTTKSGRDSRCSKFNAGSCHGREISQETTTNTVEPQQLQVCDFGPTAVQMELD